MGCSASRTITIVANSNPEDPSPSASLTSSSFSSSSASHNSNSSPPVGRRALSLPVPLVHHPPIKKGDTHHLVSLTSTTYGSLLLVDQKDPNSSLKDQPLLTKTSHQTEPEHSLSPDSVINTWELMDGLDDEEEEIAKPPYTCILDKPSSCRYTVFDGSARKKLLDSFESMKTSQTATENSSSFPASTKKPLWQHLSEEALLAKLDPSVAWSYRRALSSRQLGRNTLCRDVRSMGSSPLRFSSSFSFGTNNLCRLPGTEDRIVLYCTSLRGIRKTYEDCCSVKMMLRGFRVAVDERDISMDSSYRKELQDVLGGKAVTLPQVFIRGKYVGNAEEMKHLNESGELARLLEGFPTQDPGFVCDNCGDARFVPCPNCNGSRKVFENEDGGLRRCPDCNENGLIRCPGCCS
ncbi:electron carrier [Spatholobus suberectus]|nr:electron carrier [Spatholobus suberectus]